MQSSATTVDQYIKELPPERRETIQAIRKAILANLPNGYEETMSYGMIGYVVPHSIYPPGYACNPKLPLPFINVASQKNHYSLYMMCVYGDEPTRAWLEKEMRAAGKKLDMGKGCLRFKALEEISLDVIGRLVAKIPVAHYVARIEQVFDSNRKSRAAEKAKAAKTAKPSSKPAKPKTAKTKSAKKGTK